LIISIVSASFVAGGVIWQLALYRLAGARLEVRLTPAVVTATGGVIRGPQRGWGRRVPEEIEAVARDEAARTLADAGTHAAKIVGEAEQRVVELKNAEGEILTSLQSLKTQLEDMTARLRPVEFTAGTGVE
ncbi:MAG: hypothetical protein ACRDJI_06615, partial [Actinomycetota bacterium]